MTWISDQIADAVEARPGGTVTDIVNAVGSIDGADFWANVHYAERAGRIRSEKPDGGAWRFYPA